MTATAELRKRLTDDRILVAPGIYDAFGAMMAEKAGFEALYLSGASIAYTKLGKPDIGLVSMAEVAETVANIRERTNLPLIVDADTGFGNALNVERTVKTFERAGATAIQLEDQSLPKRCGHLAGKSLVSPGEMAGKVKAALDARRSAETLIIARTDAIAVEGFEAAMDRAELYVEAGADVLFVEAFASADQIDEVVSRFGKRLPLLINMVEGGKTPMEDAAALEAMGFSIVIFPGGLVRALARTMEDYFASLKAAGTTKPFADRMLDFSGLNDLLGTAGILEAAQKYDEENSS